MRFPGVPMSVNLAYEGMVVSRGKGKVKKRIAIRRLSDEGKKYKLDLKKHLLRNYPNAFNFFLPDNPYDLIVDFSFQNRITLHNATWLADNPQRNSTSRYKRLDVSNRTKLFEDALSEATGLDDKHNFFIGVGKSWSTSPAFTDCWAFNRETEKDNPVASLLALLKRTRLPKQNRALPEL